MSLQVWLPLDGTLENKGYADISLTNNGATVDASGKIGSCYSFNGSGNYILGSPAFLNNDSPEWSYACWFKPATSHAGCLFSNRTQTSNNGIAAFYYGNEIYFDDGRRWRFTPSPQISVGEWNHVAFTKSSTEKRFYLNGALIASTTEVGEPVTADTSAFSIGGSQYAPTTVTTNWLNGQLNDVRIYDNCLSAAEVHEISQGLVQHFTLNAYSNWLADASTERTQTRTASNTRIDYSFIPNFNESADTQFTAEFDAKGTASNMNIDVYLRTASGGFTPSASKTISTDWEHYAITFSGNASTAAVFSVRLMGGTAGDIMYLRNMRLISANMPIDDSIVYDCSGYGRNGTVYTGAASPEVVTGSPRYGNCLYFPEIKSSINAGRKAMVTDSITVNLWAYAQNTGDLTIASCTQSGGWSVVFISDHLKCWMYVTGIGYKTPISATAVNRNEWYMLTLVYDRIDQKVKIYINAEKSAELASGGANPIKYVSNTVWVGAEATANKTTPDESGIIGCISDFRIYCTPLSDDDIKALYQTSAKIDKSGNVHAFELSESDKVSITKTGTSESSQFCEYQELAKLKYDPNTYFEPDGSAWVRIFHHNNPASALFSQSDDFENSVYIDEDRWFNFEVCNDMNEWEIMMKLKTTSDAGELKFRWIQQVSPMTATFADVGAGDVEYITSEGYSSSTYGGLYKKNENSYLSANNGNAGNWWGAVGSWSLTSGTLPSWQGKKITTGYEDVYLRIDNQLLTNSTTAKIGKNKRILANKFIER